MKLHTIIRNARRLQQRDDGRCAWPACREQGDAVRYTAGATELNRNIDAELCDAHHLAFGQALDAIRETVPAAGRTTLFDR